MYHVSAYFGSCSRLIGLWQVLTDYIKCAKLRVGLQVGVVAVLLGYFFWSVYLWGA
ncbi:hypothetical protein OH492_06125 [Vibrio chagasii]|nr:hypothetical protein [Vibrio chagasii]